MATITAKNIDGGQIAIEARQIKEFKAGFQGRVFVREDEGYDSAREIWNAIFDRKPAIIARCVGASDVTNAVDFARNNHLLTAIKGGGHNSAGTGSCDGGLMIDLSLMRRVIVDSQNQTAKIEGGALLGDADKETQQHGLAVSAGIVSHTGVGGLTLGGGFGWISRKYGLSVDNLIAAEVVAADGKLVRASAEENPDLFWGIRGGGGNFGVVTSFEFSCAPIGTRLFSGLIIKKFEDAKKYMQFHRNYVRDLPDEMTAWIVVRHAPPLPFLNEDVHGKMIVVVPFVWLGDQKKGEELIKPIREITSSHGEAVGMNPWVDWQAGFDGLVAHGARNYWKSHHLKELTDDCIDKVLEFAAKMPTDECEVFIPHMEGAPSRVPETETAFAHRTTPFVLNIHTRWRKAVDDDRCLNWAKGIHSATQPFSQGVYVNFLSEGENRAKEAYTPEVWNRLVEVKKNWDPQNLFRINQNIRP
jgi:hypothetical protein